MTELVTARPSTLRALLLGGAVLAACNGPLLVGPAAAKVGVTSATDGDPLGKPPSEAERVLRIGIDVQANELITTSATDRAHLVFLDGSSLTVGPNAQLTIDRFVFDPNTKTGELAINASKGVLRLVGGKISKTSPIIITTPASTIGIRGGITLLDVKPTQTTSTFVFGSNMTVTAGGTTQTVTRPNFQVITNLGARPGPPTAVPPGALSGQLAQLEGRSAGGQSGQSSGSGRAADQAAQGSGFSSANSGQPPRITGLRGDAFGSGPGPRNRNPNDVVPNALTNANNAVQIQQADASAREAAARPASAQAGTESTAPGSSPTPGAQNQPPSTSGPVEPGLPPIPGIDPRFQIDRDVRLTTVNELNTLNAQRATATYNGPAYASIGSQNVVGTYQNVWSFGNRNGVATLQIDNATYGGGANPNTFQIANTPLFQTNGAIQSTGGAAPGRSVTLDGIFLSTTNSPAKYQIGAFNLSGPNNYSGSGVFLGMK